MSTQARFTPVEDAAALEAVFDASFSAPAVLFLDDPYCPISARAHDEVTRVPATVAQVDVSEQHDLSRAIAQRTGVRHESPQVFVLRDGKAAWSASHGRITAAAITAALTANG